MPTNTGAPNGAMSTAASEQLPDCIIASSNRFSDLLPFCNSLYQADPQKWGCILPWEFPQSANKEVEEAFLRTYFSEVDIHMQGGAHGTGEGFRFLKQAWYSIALWNYEKRVPSIADWWLNSKENSSVLKDLDMCEHLCKPEVTPETFFESRDIQMYGKALLSCVVKRIQDTVKAQQLKAMEQLKTTSTMRSASDSAVITETGNSASLFAASSSIMSPRDQDSGSTDEELPKVIPVSAPADRLMASIATESERTTGKHGGFIGESERSPWNAEYTNTQAQRGKRGGRLGSGGNGHRGASYDRRSQEHQHRYNPYMGPSNNGFEMHPSSSAGPVLGTMQQPNQAASAYPEFQFAMQGAPPAPAYNNPGARNTRQYARGRNFQYNELQPLPAMNPGMFGVATNINQPAHQREMERVASEGSSYSAFNDLSVSGDARRNSIGSRGGGPRGYGHNRGGKRGGRARDSGNQTPYFAEESYGARKPSSDFYARPNLSSGKRRGGVYQANTWRSGSEHPQVENDFPQRVLSMPEQYQYPGFQDLSGVARSHQLPPFSFPHAQNQGHQGPPEHRPAPVRLPNQLRSFPDLEVDERYIGADATHVTELIAFNIPIQATEEDVAKNFRIACDVEVVDVRFNYNAKYGPEDCVKVAFVRFPNHIAARHVLDLREIQLYGKPMTVRVPRSMLSEKVMPPGVESHGHRPDPNFEGELHQWPHDYQRAHAPPTQLGHAVPIANSHGYPHEASHHDLASVPAFMPTKSSRAENPMSTVLSSNATPTASVTNTPKKKGKKKQKNKPQTPRDQTTEDESSLQARLTKEPSLQETPVKPQRKQQRLQDHATSSDLVSSKGVVSDSNPASKDQEKSRKALGVGENKKRSGSVSASISQATTKTESINNSPQKPQTIPDTVPKVSPHPRTSSIPPSDADLGSHTQPLQDPTTDRELQSLHLSSQGSEEDGSAVDVTHDSDHVDESFHTASASPPMDKFSQSQPTSKDPGKSTGAGQPIPSKTTARKPATPSQDKQSVVDTDDHIGTDRGDETVKESESPASPVSPNKSGQNATPPKKQSAGVPAKSKSPQPTSQRSVSDQSDAREMAFRPEASAKGGNATELRHPATQRVIFEDRGYVRTDLSMNKYERKSQENNAPGSATQRVVSGGSVPETPMTAYYTAPTTPTPILNTTPEKVAEESSGQLKAASSLNTTPEKATAAADQSSVHSKSAPSPTTAGEKGAGKASAESKTASSLTTAPKKNPQKASVQSKTPIKKGPSQTESFSNFGKKQEKQQKQKKQAKGKGSLKGKPLESGDVPRLAGGIAGQNASGNASPARSSGVPSSGRKPTLSIETRSEIGASESRASVPARDFKSDETTLSESTTQAVSGQESPTKGGLRNFFGLFNRSKSPSVSGKDTSAEDAPQQDVLTGSKASAAIPETDFSIDHLLQGAVQDRVDEQALSDQATHSFPALDHGSDLDSTGGLVGAGLGISTPSGSSPKETPKKKRKKKKSKSASAQQNEARDKSYPGRDEDKEDAASESASSTRRHAVDGSFDGESDNRSDQSSTTMGRPTPPVSPKGLTPGRRKRIEQRMTEEHIVSSPAPRNKHVKKKSYSRAASSGASTAPQESSLSSQSTTVPVSQTETNQQSRLLQVFQLSPRASVGSSGGDDDSQRTGLFMSDMANEDGNSLQVNLLTVHLNDPSNLVRILDICNYARRSNSAGSDDVTEAIEAMDEDDDAATEATISDLGTPDMEE